MPVPVMTVVAAIRHELAISAREAAGNLGIAHGFLQQTEEFEYVPAPEYRTAKEDSLSYTLIKFFEGVLPSLNPPLFYVTKSLISHISAALNNDAKFHVLAVSGALEDVFIPLLGSTAYGPLFSFLREVFIERAERKVFLRTTGEVGVDYFLDFVMFRFWGHRAAQRRRHARSVGFVYKSLLRNGSQGGYLGFFEGCTDPREIFWLHPHYTARRSFLPYLFLYLVLTRLSFSFSLPPAEKQEYRTPPILHEDGVLSQKPVYCAVTVPGACRSPLATCNAITLLCPGQKLVNFFWRPEGGGSSTHYCVRYAVED